MKPGRKQIAILDWLGFHPATNSTRRIMARIHSSAVTIRSLFYLRDALKDKTLRKTLSHLPFLQKSVLRIATDPELVRLVTFDFLHSLALSRRERFRSDCAHILNDCWRMVNEMRNPDIRIPVIRNMAQLGIVHEELSDELNRGLYDFSKYTFPPPPFSGNDTIIPITTPEALQQEGRWMHHCVASYASEVARKKNIYIYRVLAPERATLAIAKTPRGWEISQLRCLRNSDPSPETVSAAYEWLLEAQQNVLAREVEMIEYQIAQEDQYDDEVPF